MILMYHHVCSSDEIPLAQVPLEGWKYKLEPAAVESQLRAIVARGYRCVTLKAYLAEMAIGGSTISQTPSRSSRGWIFPPRSLSFPEKCRGSHGIAA